MISTHTGYGASEVYGVPDSSGGAGDASGVGAGSGSQHSHRNTETGVQHAVMEDTASDGSVWTSMAHLSARRRRQILTRMGESIKNRRPAPSPDIA